MEAGRRLARPAHRRGLPALRQAFERRVPDIPRTPLVADRARGITIRLGGVGHIAEYAMTGADVRRTAVPRTLSMALALGRAIRLAREEHRSPFEAIADTLSTTLYPHLRELCVGKVVDVERRTTEGFAKGRATIAPLGADDGDVFEISFQNDHQLGLGAAVGEILVVVALVFGLIYIRAQRREASL